MNLYTLTSELHDEQAVNAVTKEFLDSLHIIYNYKGSDYATMAVRTWMSSTSEQVAPRAFSNNCCLSCSQGADSPSIC